MTTRRRTLDRFRSGFTLIELLFAIGIVALLIAIVTPAIMYAQRVAVRHRLAGDMVTISNALEAYKADFGDYPQVSTNEPGTGFAVLGKALVGAYGDGVLSTGSPPPNDPNDPPTYDAGKMYLPGDCVQTGGAKYVAIRENAGVSLTDSTSNQAWLAFNPNDALDGFGTRLSGGGKKVGPYVQSEKFRVRGCAFLDSNDKPILYFYARHAKPNLSITLKTGPGGATEVPPFISQTALSVFNAADNLYFFKRPFEAAGADMDDTRATARMAGLLGDTNNDGLITGGEQAASTGPFLLWAPGPDGFYGPVTHPSTTAATAVEIGKCDDVTNFR